MIKNYLIVDIESYFNSESGYDLKDISLTEYIRDTQFKLHGIGFDIEKQSRWTTEIENLKKAVNWSETALVAHNIKFDAAVLAWHYGIVPALYIDTKGLAKAVLGPYISGYSLDEVGKYLGLESKGTILHKFDGVRDCTPEQEADLAEYCLNDVAICKGIFEKLWSKFPESQRHAMDWTIRTFINPQLTLDVNILARMVDNEKSRREDAIKQSGVDKRVLSSNKQFAALLSTRGIQTPTKRSERTGKEIPALGISDTGFLALKDIDPVLFEARKAAKSTIIETRGEKLINVGKTGPWPFDVQFSGAVQTHRYSGGDGAGGNPQNFPRASIIKQAIVLSQKQRDVFVVGDFAAIELRINAWLAKEQWLIDMLSIGEDVYSAFASKVYKRTITKTDKVERQFGKCCELGLGYGMGKDKFQNTVRVQTGETVTIEHAKEVVKLYRDTHPNIKALWYNAEALLPQMIEGQKNRVFFAPFLGIEKNALVLPSGLKIMYPNLRREGDEWVYDRYYKRYEPSPEKIYGGKIIENICQALAGELCKEAIDKLVSYNVNVVGQVHDEILVVANSKIAEKTRRLVETAMGESPSWWLALKLKAEVGTGTSWAGAKV